MQHELAKRGFRLENKVWKMFPYREADSFSKSYYKLRQKEGYIYSDETLSRLPEISYSNPLFKQWQIRKNSLGKLIRHIRQRFDSPLILDLGCGNGWMSGMLSYLANGEVWAMDLVPEELEQGARVFKCIDDLHFVYGDIYSDQIPENYFDLIILGSCVQYFQDCAEIIPRLKTLLKPGGEIHIFDSPLYKNIDCQKARLRSLEYYTKMGFPELHRNYHAHSIEQINSMEGMIMYNPQTLKNKIRTRVLRKADSPFYWVMFRK